MIRIIVTIFSISSVFKWLKKALTSGVVQVDIGVDGEKLSKELIEEVDEPSFIVRFKLGGHFF